MKTLCIMVILAGVIPAKAGLTLLRTYDAANFNTNTATLADSSGQNGAALTTGSGTPGTMTPSISSNYYGAPVFVATGAGPQNRAYLDFRQYGVLTGGDGDDMFNDPNSGAGGYTMEGYFYFSATMHAPQQNMGIGVSSSVAIQNQFIVIKAREGANNARCGQTETTDGAGDGEEHFRYLETSFYNDVNLLLPLNEWVHVVKVHDPVADEVRWYTNGVLAVKQKDWKPASPKGFLASYALRARTFGSVGENSREVGGIWSSEQKPLSGLGYSLVRFYRGAATEAEIQTLYKEVTGVAKSKK